MNYFENIVTYHGTTDLSADELVGGGVDILVGGGELGQGFYLGTFLHVAKAWSKQKHKSEAVVEFIMKDEDFWGFDIQTLNMLEAIEYRSIIRSLGHTRTFKFSKDLVWSPIVGGPRIYADQHKWESTKGQDFLNGSTVYRRKR